MPRKPKAPPRADGRYTVRMVVGHEINGDPIKKDFYSRISKADAKRKALEYIEQKKLADVTQGMVPTPESVPFSTWARKWLESYKKGRVKERTYADTYERIVERKLIPYFGNTPLSQIKAADIERFYNLMAKQYSTSELHKMDLNLTGIFTSAVDNDLIYKNPTNLVKAPKGIPLREKPTYTEDQVAIICEYALQHPYGLPAILMLCMGLRISEVCGLRAEDVDLENRTITVRQAITKYRGSAVIDVPKSKRPRTIPMDEITFKALSDPNLPKTGYLLQVNGHPFVPEKMDRDRYHSFLDDLRKEHPDIPVYTPHSCRHTCGTILYNKTHDLYAVSRFLGHSDIKITAKIYVHDSVEDLRNAVGRAVKPTDSD